MPALGLKNNSTLNKPDNQQLSQAKVLVWVLKKNMKQRQENKHTCNKNTYLFIHKSPCFQKFLFPADASQHPLFKFIFCFIIIFSFDKYCFYQVLGKLLRHMSSICNGKIGNKCLIIKIYKWMVISYIEELLQFKIILPTLYHL